MSQIEIRKETEADEGDIYRVTELAFRDRPYADGDEQDVVQRLRESGALVLSLVAVENEILLGQVSFSPAINSGGSHPWFALGPVSVLPSRQGEGIGARLILAGLNEIESLGARGCILTGNPDYYRRFGFELAPANVPANEPAAYFMLKLFEFSPPEGSFSFHAAFYDET